MKPAGWRSISSHLVTVLSILWYTLAGVLVVTFVIVVASLFADIRGLELTLLPPSFGVQAPDHNNWTITIPVSLAVEPPTGTATSPSLGINNGEIKNLQGLLKFPIRRGSFFMANAVVLMLAMAFGLWIIGQLRAVVRAVRDGKPFIPENAARVRRLGWAMIVGELIRTAVVFFESSYAMQHFSIEGLRFSTRPDFSVFAIVQGMIVLVIAEVFRAGTRLDEEQSLTV
jgi:Protein of unknown function (DUF2975)